MPLLAQQSSAPTLKRGQRASSESQGFTLVSVNAVSNGSGLQIDLTFSVPVNPESLNSSTVSINSRAISADTKITYNREGTKVRLEIPNVSSSNPELTLNGVKSNEGDRLASVTIKLN